MLRPHGIILFAHGARDPAWAQPFQAVRTHVEQLRPDTRVALAFLEFMPPSLPEAAQQLAAQGCAEVQVVPLFLGAGGHVRKDLPHLMQALEKQHPDVRWTLQPAIGEDPEVIAAMAAVVARMGRTG
ncbi:sirohydrochlorin chelatase [Caldimonas caldifontis]|uniref:Cobalamin biosynthesis protein CbiX n=1 Tax=Caldimonas caldifontis TaxID=1452508 RepID=A0A2S5STC5_9BURK|nr:CbiX/SirB N-terminal domain-containing protein [Caldimonas caldifontis]PPE65990.1 cobalamin biosynthesis protein CbiX [Caldimonas caldifontis]